MTKSHNVTGGMSWIHCYSIHECHVTKTLLFDWAAARLHYRIHDLYHSGHILPYLANSFKLKENLTVGMISLLGKSKPWGQILQ